MTVALSGLEDATASAQGFSGAVSGVGDAAATATAAAAPLGTAIDQTAVSLGNAKSNALDLSDALKGQVGPAVDAAYNAFDRLANAQGVRGLSRDIALATVATQQFQSAVEAAEASGVAMPPAVGNALKAMQTDIDAATVKLGVFRKAQQDVTASSALAGSQLDALRGQAGSLTSMFSSMEKTGTGLTSSIGALGMGLGIAGMAFIAAKATGEAFAKVIDTVANAHLGLMDAQLKVQTEQAALGLQLQAVSKGAMEMGGSISDMAKNWDNYQLSQGRGNQALKDAAAGILGIKTASMSYTATQDKMAEGAAFLAGLFKNDADAQSVLTDKTNILTAVQMQNIALEEKGTQTAAAKHDADWRLAEAEDGVVVAETKATATHFALIAAISQSTNSINAYMQMARDMGDAVPVEFLKALDAASRLKKTHDDLKVTEDALMAVWKNVPAVISNQTQMYDKLQASAQLVGDSHEKLNADIIKILDTLAKDTAAAALATNSTKALGDAYDKAQLSLAAYAKTHEISIADVMLMVKNQGGLLNAIQSTNEATAANQFGPYGAVLGQAADRVKTLVEQETDLLAAIKATDAAMAANVATVKARNDAIDKGIQVASNLAAAQANGIAIDGQATIMNLTLASATAEQNTALVNLLKTQNAYTAAVQNTLGVAKGWNDYLAELLSSYQSGALSLISYKAALEAFQTQLEQTFSGATGKAKDALNSMIATIQTLINTAGAGGGAPADTSVTGALNKAFNTP